jgi:hypothetical protein
MEACQVAQGIWLVEPESLLRFEGLHQPFPAAGTPCCIEHESILAGGIAIFGAIHPFVPVSIEKQGGKG